MRVGTDDCVYRDYIKATMSAGAQVESNGVYKLDRGDAITRSGRCCAAPASTSCRS